MIDGNMDALNKHLKEREDTSLAFERLIGGSLDDYLNDINALIDDAKSIAKVYEGHDFEDEAVEFLKDGVEL